MAKMNTQIVISTIVLSGDELRSIADAAVKGDVISNEILNGWLPRWLLRLLLGENVVYQAEKIRQIVNRQTHADALVKLLRDYIPDGND